MFGTMLQYGLVAAPAAQPCFAKVTLHWEELDSTENLMFSAKEKLPGVEV